MVLSYTNVEGAGIEITPPSYDMSAEQAYGNTVKLHIADKDNKVVGNVLVEITPESWLGDAVDFSELELSLRFERSMIFVDKLFTYKLQAAQGAKIDISFVNKTEEDS